MFSGLCCPLMDVALYRWVFIVKRRLQYILLWQFFLYRISNKYAVKWQSNCLREHSIIRCKTNKCLLVTSYHLLSGAGTEAQTLSAVSCPVTINTLNTKSVFFAKWFVVTDCHPSSAMKWKFFLWTVERLSNDPLPFWQSSTCVSSGVQTCRGCCTTTHCFWASSVSHDTHPQSVTHRPSCAVKLHKDETCHLLRNKNVQLHKTPTQSRINIQVKNTHTYTQATT